jgi:hypothetical protein
MAPTFPQHLVGPRLITTPRSNWWAPIAQHVWKALAQEVVSPRARHVDEQRALHRARTGKAAVGEELLRQHTRAQRRIKPRIWGVLAGGLQNLGNDALSTAVSHQPSSGVPGCWNSAATAPTRA